MSLHIDDLEVDASALVAMLQEAFQLGIANGVEYTLIGLNRPRSNGNTIRRCNAILDKTWGDDAWRDRVIHYLLEAGRESHRKPEEGE